MCQKSTSEIFTHLKNGDVIYKSFCELLEQKNRDGVLNFDIFKKGSIYQKLLLSMEKLL
jgi:hypothetical protein